MADAQTVQGSPLVTRWPSPAGATFAASAEADAKYVVLIGKRLRILRTFHGPAQEEVARRAGVTRNYLSAVERGRQGLDAVRARRLAVVLGVSIGDLLADLTLDGAG